MLTGDMQDSANRIAQQVQVDEVHARMFSGGEIALYRRSEEKWQGSDGWRWDE